MKYAWALALIMSISLGIRLYRLDYPNKYYFDEVYHAVTSKAYANNNPAGYEWWHPAPEPDTAYEWLHPPLGKLLMAGGIKLFGPEPWAWRLPGVIFGLGIIGLTYWLGKIISGSQRIGLMAGLLVSLDGLLLAQSRIGMNDIYVTFFMLAAVGCYSISWLRHRDEWLLISGVMTGLAVSTKWSGVFVLGMVGLMEMYRWYVEGKLWWRRLPKLMGIYGLIPTTIYFLSFGQFWIQGHSISQFRELHQQIWWYQTHLEATHPYQSKAWEWPLMIRPVWYFVDYLDNGRVANIYNLGNPLLLWTGLIAQGGLLIRVVKKFRKKREFLPELVWLGSYLLSWMPWSFSPRIMFFYHYAPAVPFLTLGLATLLDNQLNAPGGKWLIATIIGGIGLCFIWFLPIWIGIPLTQTELMMRLLLPNWK